MAITATSSAARYVFRSSAICSRLGSQSKAARCPFRLPFWNTLTYGIFRCPAEMSAWANVPEEQKAHFTGCVYEFFNINPRRYSKADYKLIVDGIEDTAARRYRQYNANVNA
ncbi:hypothetical protein Fot_29492 [Forsythia ovata]|uniref:Uncharacterized protein n=1 Tax=Forsythia ovata TaxID=205694 RepID=A0ABD1TS19_9LAMI